MKAKGYSTIAGLERLTPEEIKKRNQELYGSKIKAYRRRAGLTAEQLAEVLKISKSSVRNWECGLTRPDPEFLFRMFSILDVEPNEFFGIKGVGTLLTAREQRLLRHYRELDRRSQGDLEALAKALADRACLRKLSHSFHNIISTPDYGRMAAAGTIGVDWPVQAEDEPLILLSSPLVRRADEAITVSGDSMEPQFHHGDTVLVEYCSEIRNGDIGIFFVPGVGGVIKQKACDRLHSINPDYDDIFPYEDSAQLIGRVLCRVDASMRPTHEQIRLYKEAVQELEKNPAAFDAFDE